MSAQVIMLASGKGGTGKSTISASLSVAAAKQGKRILLVALDAGLCSLDLFFHMQDRIVFDLQDVCSGRCAPADAVFAHPDYPQLSLLCAPSVDRWLHTLWLTGRLLSLRRILYPCGMRSVFLCCFRLSASVF